MAELECESGAIMSGNPRTQEERRSSRHWERHHCLVVLRGSRCGSGWGAAEERGGAPGERPGTIYVRLSTSVPGRVSY